MVNDIELKQDDDNKKKIIELFRNNVLGKIYSEEENKNNHDGGEGHWLEKLMGIQHNSKTEPDIFGYEMKSKTASKTSFGDWCPDIDDNGNKLEIKWWNEDNKKTNFMKQYGGYNKEKERWSWANPIKNNSYNKFGQKFIIDDIGIFVVYNKNYDKSYDTRDIKDNNEDKKLFGWSHKEMNRKVTSKFGNKWYFRPLKSKDGTYIGLQFGNPISYDEFIDNVKSNDIFFDPGTYVGNSRPYMQWRAENKWFDKREENNLDDKYIMVNKEPVKKNK